MALLNDSANAVAEKQKHDKFCWKCCGEGTTLRCSGCVRSYHTNCSSIIEEDTDNPANFRCYMCMKLLDAVNKDKKCDLDMLPILIDKVLKDKTFNMLKSQLTAASYTEFYVTDSIVNPMDLSIIKKNIATYTSFEQFIADIQWIAHNCFILFIDNKDKMESAKSLVDHLEEEIENIKKCSECFSNEYKHPSKWFTMVCDKPHIILWAKKMGFNYWPAKLMSIDGQLINVRFFGDHKPADVPANNCFLYSEANPNRSRNASYLYKSALKEADDYIDNARKKFGSYNYIETKGTFNPARLEKYMAKVFPYFGAKAPTPRTIAADPVLSEQYGKQQLKILEAHETRLNSNENVNKTNEQLKKCDIPSSQKNVIISLPRVKHNECKRKPKRNGDKLNDEDEPHEKKIRLKPSILETSVKEARSASKSPDAVNVKNDKNQMNGEAKVNAENKVKPEEELNPLMRVDNDDKNKMEMEIETEIESNDVKTSPEKPIVTQPVIEIEENAIESTVQSEKVEQLTEEKMIGIACNSENPMISDKSNVIDFNQSGFSDLNTSALLSFEELSSMANFDGPDWEHSVSKEIEDTVRKTTAKMCSSLQQKFKTKFEVLKNNWKTMKSERDQLTVDAEKTKQKLKDDHAKEIAQLNENFAKQLLNANNDATQFWSDELERVKTKAENDLKQINTLMQEKVEKVEETYEKIKTQQEKEKQEHNQVIADLQEKHTIEMNAEKQRMNLETETMKQLHNDKLKELENKLKEAIEQKANIEAQIEDKYCEIVANMKQKADNERKERMTCAGCGKQLELKQTCSQECNKLWSVFTTEKTL